MAKTSDILGYFESIIASALAESTDTPCSACQCKSLPQAASELAEEIADTLAYEWGGQQVYFCLTENSGEEARRGIASNLGDEFLVTLEQLLSSSLKTGSPFPYCKNCESEHDDWGSTISFTVSELYEAMIGQIVNRH